MVNYNPYVHPQHILHTHTFLLVLIYPKQEINRKELYIVNAYMGVLPNLSRIIRGSFT